MITPPSNSNSKQRIALFIESLACGGAEKVTVILANALVQRGYQVDLLMRWEHGKFLDDLDPDIHRFSPSRASGTPFQTLRFLIDYMRDRKPAALLAHMEKPSLLALLAGVIVGYKNIVPCVHTDLTTYAKLEHCARRTILKYLVAVFYRLAIRIVAVSTGTAQSTAALIGRKAPPIDVILNGFNIEKMRQRAQEDTGIPWLQNKTMPVIIACGRLVEQKGYDVLLRAFAVLRQTMAARLIILGDGPMRAQLEETARALKIADDVTMPNCHPNPAACFGHSDLFVLASRVEGLSNVLIEALIVGVPVVSTDCPTGPREVLQNGRFGSMVPVDDVGALAEAMRAALLAAANDTPVAPEYASHIRKFSVETMVDGYISTVNKVIGKRIV